MACPMPVRGKGALFQLYNWSAPVPSTADFTSYSLSLFASVVALLTFPPGYLMRILTCPTELLISLPKWFLPHFSSLRKLHSTRSRCLKSFLILSSSLLYYVGNNYGFTIENLQPLLLATPATNTLT